MTTDFNTTLTHLEHLLTQEEEVTAIGGRLELDAHLIRRKKCAQMLTSLEEHLKHLRSRFHALPLLPPLELVHWAESILRFPNLALVVLETTGIHRTADILRLVVVDAQETLLFDQIVQSRREPKQPNTRYTGLTLVDITHSPSLSEVWQAFAEVLAGRYVLAYNLDFVQERLDENAAHYGLQPIYLIGKCLQEQAIAYYRASSLLKLTDVLTRIGYALPSPAPAPLRAQGQLALLRAMSAGITSELNQEDEQTPF